MNKTETLGTLVCPHTVKVSKFEKLKKVTFMVLAVIINFFLSFRLTHWL